MTRSIRLLFGIIGIFLCVSCENLPTAPTSRNSGVDRGPFANTWSPYVVIHPHGGTVAGQNYALRKLAAAGNLRGIRIGTDSKGEFRYFLGGFIQGLNNIDILGIVGAKDLVSPDLENTMGEIYRMYPEVKYFQIGNEYVIPEINDGIAMDPATYMEKFKRIYDYTIRNHPRVTLVTAATISGGGPGGAQALEEMGILGLNKMDTHRVILSMNVYDVGSASAYVPVLAKFPGFRVWVTESGSIEPKNHKEHVQTVYPAIGNMLRAERIYWYALWEGDEDKDINHGFGLIVNAKEPKIIERDLFKALTGGIEW